VRKSTLDLPREAVDHDREAVFTLVAEIGMHFAVSNEQFSVVIVLTLQMVRELSAITFRATRSI
jgi:hypothetical protein